MDRGEVFKQPMCIQPQAEGSFIVDVGAPGLGSTYGFTNLGDLLNWLVANAQAAAAVKVDQLTEAQIVPNKWPQSLVRPGVKRTTAAEIIREREEREEYNSAAALTERLRRAAGQTEPESPHST